jgi:hypothetical protein
MNNKETSQGQKSRTSEYLALLLSQWAEEIHTQALGRIALIAMLALK